MSILERPEWLKRVLPAGEYFSDTERLLQEHHVNTVCQSAHCPNIGECFSAKTATFMILGTNCTRRCRFCTVGKEEPSPVDSEEAMRVRQAAQEMGLQYVVITSVTRDDLPDGGSHVFSQCIQELRQYCPETQVEVLIPDFQGNSEAIDTVLSAGPDVLNHNIETVPRLYSLVRPEANYQRSLTLLKTSSQQGKMKVKSGIMVGLGETKEEIFDVLNDLKRHGVDFVTIGQYLRPSEKHLPIDRYVTPEEFSEYGKKALEIGFSAVASGPFVRSSYQAARMMKEKA